jgi:dienelactone hydrolase
MKILLLLLLIVMFSIPALAQSASDSAMQRGTVTGKITVRADATQSYAAYLPSSYTPAKKWPIIFCFDPLARGKFAVEHFQAAAEKYGYVVVCSNDSHNGLDPATTQKIVTAYYGDVRERIAVDDIRTYVAGFSGGARLSISVAATCNGCVAGVIAVGAGFPPNLQPAGQQTFAFFGAAGFDDFNFSEMRALHDKFVALPVDFSFHTFAGRHEWMDAATADAALAWFDLVAMKTGALKRDDKLIGDQLNMRRTEAARFAADGRFIDAYQAYASIARDFAGWSDVTQDNDRAQQLRASAEFKKEVRNEKDLATRQLKDTVEINTLWQKTRSMSGDDPDPRQEARDRLAEMRRRDEAATDTPERRLARRTLFGIYVGAIETSGALTAQKSYSAAASWLELARAASTKDPCIAYQLARVYALDGRKKDALQMLEESFKFGFTNLTLLKQDEAFASLAREPRFQKLLGPAK